jgi:hypothetical protein
MVTIEMVVGALAQGLLAPGLLVRVPHHAVDEIQIRILGTHKNDSAGQLHIKINPEKKKRNMTGENQKMLNQNPKNLLKKRRKLTLACPES